MAARDLNRSHSPHCPPAVNFTGIGVPRLWLGHLCGGMKMAWAGMLQEYSGKRRQRTQTHWCGTMFHSWQAGLWPSRRDEGHPKQLPYQAYPSLVAQQVGSYMLCPKAVVNDPVCYFQYASHIAWKRYEQAWVPHQLLVRTVTKPCKSSTFLSIVYDRTGTLAWRFHSARSVLLLNFADEETEARRNQRPFPSGRDPRCRPPALLPLQAAGPLPSSVKGKATLPSLLLTSRVIEGQAWGWMKNRLQSCEAQQWTCEWLLLFLSKYTQKKRYEKKVIYVFCILH